MSPQQRHPTENLIVSFHGHCGPWVALGYRMGTLARRWLGSPGYFDLDALVVTAGRPPTSCVIDGVQLGSGCTTGKGNLRTRVGERVRAAFRRRGGAGVEISLGPDLVERLVGWTEALGVEGAGRRILGTSDAELFEVKDL